MKLRYWIASLLLFASYMSSSIAMTSTEMVKAINQARTINQHSLIHHRAQRLSDTHAIAWSSLHGPIIGQSVAIVQMKNQPSMLFAYRPNVSSILYRSKDAGKTWQPLNTPQHVNLYKLVSIDQNRLLFGTNDGLYASTDQGSTWTKIPHFEHSIGRIFVSQPDLILAAVDIGHLESVYRSTDLGQTWTPANLGLDTDWPYEVLAGRGQVIFTCTNGLFVSTNGGLLWTRPNKQWEDANTRSLAVTSKLDAYSIGAGELYKTDYTGKTWEKIITDSFPGYLESIQVDTQDHLFLIKDNHASNQFDLYRSMDNGHTWQKLFTAEYISHITILDNGQILVSTDQGLFQSNTAQQSFKPITTAFSVSSTKHVLIKDENHLFAIDGGYGSSDAPDVLYRSTDAGKTWQIAYKPAHGHFQGLAEFQDHLLLATPQKMLVSDDLGQSWQTVSQLNDGGSNLMTDNNAVLVTRSDGIYLSTDLTHWQQVIKMSNNSWAQAYYDGKNIYAYANSTIKVTADQGQTWTTLLDNLNQFSALIHGYQDKVLVVAFPYAGVIKSTDGGKNWDFINQGIYDVHYKTLHVIDENQYLLATDQGMFFTKDGGKHWTAENHGLENENVHDFAVKDHVILVGTDGAGVFRADLTP